MHFQNEIDRYLEDGLPPAREQELRAHLDGCAECRAYYDRQATLFRALAGNPAAPTPRQQAQLMQRILARTHGEPVPPPVVAAAPQFRARPWALAWLGTCAVAATLVLWMTRDSAAGVAQVQGAEGLTVNGVAAEAGARVESGMVLEVTAPGQARLRLSRGAELTLAGGTRAVLLEEGNLVRLERGRARSQVEKGRGGYAVQTVHGTARVLGTSFDVELISPREGTQVRVLEGRVRVEDVTTGLTRELLAGQDALLGAPPPVEPTVLAPTTPAPPVETPPAQPPPALVHRPRKHTAAAVADAPVEPPVDREATARASLTRAQKSLLDGRYRDAITEATTALAMDPNLAEAHRVLGYAHQREGDACRAKSHFMRSLDLEPTDRTSANIRSLLLERIFEHCRP
ncbi:MAG: FecR domain-containing protein [Myxococcota bacterium]